MKELEKKVKFFVKKVGKKLKFGNKIKKLEKVEKKLFDSFRLDLFIKEVDYENDNSMKWFGKTKSTLGGWVGG